MAGVEVPCPGDLRPTSRGGAPEPYPIGIMSAARRRSGELTGAVSLGTAVRLAWQRDVDRRDRHSDDVCVPPAPDPAVQRRRLSFGAVVRDRRKALGLSQEQLAEKAGCDRQSINRYENAAFSPSLDRTFLLADALHLSLSELLRDVDRADRTT